MTPPSCSSPASAGSSVDTSPPGSRPTRDIERVLGVDTVPPPRDLLRRMGRAEFVRADIRNPLIAKVISQAAVDTVVHASLSANPGSSGRPYGDEGDERHRHHAAARGLPEGPDGAADGAEVDHRRVRVEPARPGAVQRVDDAQGPARPAATPRTPPRSRATCAASPAAGPTSSVTVLRFANFIGPRIDTVFTRYFALPVVPTVLGYDARVQLLHEEDALAVLERATSRGPARRVQRGRRRRAAALPGHPPGRPGAAARARALAVGPVEQAVPRRPAGRLLPGADAAAQLRPGGRHPRLRDQFGFTPRWTTVQAFDDYVRGRALRPVLGPGAVRVVERGVLAVARALR